MSSSSSSSSSLPLNYYYDILECSIDSTREEIQRAVRKLSLKYHSDKTDNERHHEQFLKVQQAKEVLLDDEQRMKIDDSIRAQRKRQQHDQQRDLQMNDTRKRMREKLESSIGLVSTKKGGDKQVPSSHQVNHKNSMNDVKQAHKQEHNDQRHKDKLNELRRNAAKQMEEFAKQQDQEQREEQSDIFKTLISSEDLYPKTSHSENCVKLKWNRRVQQTKDSLWELFSSYQVLSITMLTEHSAIIVFDENDSNGDGNGGGEDSGKRMDGVGVIDAVLERFKHETDYRISIVPTSTTSRSKASVFTHKYTNNNHQNSSESELFAAARRASERDRLQQFLSTTTEAPAQADANQSSSSVLPVAPKSSLSVLSKEGDILARMKQKKLQQSQSSTATS